MRGEKARLTFFSVLKRGSPPHARGKAYEWGKERIDARITPACAGKSEIHPRGSIGGIDHPRMRGEKDALDFLCGPAIGSPSHARGKAILRM